MEYSNLSVANLVRQKEWDPEVVTDASYKANELAGEVGEVCNVVKKLERERLGMRGSRSSLEALGQELADVAICLDLLAQHYNINLSKEIAVKFNLTSEKVGLKTRMVA